MVRKIKPNEAIMDIEAEWDFEKGFFGKLRQGSFDAEAFNRILFLLKTVDSNCENFPVKFVKLTWYIPLFMQWQKDRCVESGYDRMVFDKNVNEVIGTLEALFGVP